ncbi:unnamed protein product, partial [Hapterophycus canaliculatus]
LKADVYKTLEELVPLQVNVQAVASREEFFQEENYASLAHVQERLKDFIRQMQSVPAGDDARDSSNDNNVALGEALEWAAGALAKIQEIIEPAAMRRNSVSLRAWAMCAALLERAILQAQLSADPDRPLKPSEWGRLEDEKPPPAQVPEDRQRIITLRARESARAGGGVGDEASRRRRRRRRGEEEEALLQRRRQEEALAQRRRLELLRKGATVLHWAGADTEKELPLEDGRGGPFDGGVSPWAARAPP